LGDLVTPRLGVRAAVSGGGAIVHSAILANFAALRAAVAPPFLPAPHCLSFAISTPASVSYFSSPNRFFTSS